MDADVVATGLKYPVPDDKMLVRLDIMEGSGAVITRELILLPVDEYWGVGAYMNAYSFGFGPSYYTLNVVRVM